MKLIFLVLACSWYFPNRSVVAAVSPGSCTSGRTIRIIFIASSGGSDGKTQGALPAVLMARDRVNNNSCNLSGQQLQILTNHSLCDRKQALDIFHYHLFDSTPKTAIIGTGCSRSSEAIAEVSQYYSLSMISYASSSPYLDNRELFPYFFRTVPSLSFVTLGMAKIIEYFNWKRVVIVTQEDTMYHELSKNLIKHLKDNDVLIKGDFLLQKNTSKIMAANLFLPDVRIIILNMDPDHTRYILCEALSIISNYKYVWLTHGWYDDGWWNSSSYNPVDFLPESINCADNELLRFLHQQRVLGISHYPVTLNRTASTISGITTEDFEHEYSKYQEKINEDGFEGGGDFDEEWLKENTPSTALFAYDAVYALVMALSEVNNAHSFNPINVSQETRMIGEKIRHRIDNISFLGVSGNVKFRAGSRVINKIRVIQYREESNINPELVAYIHIMNESELSFEVLKEIWPNNKTPSDGSPYTVERYPHLFLVISSYVLAIIAILMAVICLIFNFIFRNRKLIKLSSPNLNYVIGMGVIVFCSAVFFFAYPPLDSSVINIYCSIRSWLAAIGYSLCFGTINTKMWRVYYIFHNPKPAAKKKPLKDIHLFLFVLTFITVDIFILVIVTPIDAIRLQAELFSNKELPSEVDEDGITVNYKVFLCESRWKNLWLGVIFGYKFVIQAIGVYLAYKIRDVKIKVLNDSNEIVVSLYLSSFILVVVITISILYGEYLNVYTAAYAIGITLSSLVVLGVVFISKMVRLYKDPTGTVVLNHAAHDMGNTGASVVGTLNENQIHELKMKVKRLEAQLAEHKTDTKNDLALNNVTFETFKDNNHFPPPSPTSDGKQVEML